MCKLIFDKLEFTTKSPFKLVFSKFTLVKLTSMKVQFIKLEFINSALLKSVPNNLQSFK